MCTSGTRKNCVGACMLSCWVVSWTVVRTVYFSINIQPLTLKKKKEMRKI